MTVQGTPTRLLPLGFSLAALGAIAAVSESRTVSNQGSSDRSWFTFCHHDVDLRRTAELMALWFKSIGHEIWFSYYLTAVIAIALLVALTMHDTKRYSLIGRHE